MYPENLEHHGNQKMYFAVGLGSTPGVYLTREEKDAAIENYQDRQFPSWQIFPTEQQAQLYVAAFANYPTEDEWNLIDRESTYYAVGVGERPGVYFTWEDCKQAKGQRGILPQHYRKFPSIWQCLLFVKAFRTPVELDINHHFEDGHVFWNEFESEIGELLKSNSPRGIHLPSTNEYY